MKILTALMGAVPISFVRARYRSHAEAATPVHAPRTEPQPRATDWQTAQRADAELAMAAMFYLCR